MLTKLFEIGADEAVRSSGDLLDLLVGEGVSHGLEVNAKNGETGRLTGNADFDLRKMSQERDRGEKGKRPRDQSGQRVSGRGRGRWDGWWHRGQRRGSWR